MHVWGFLTRKAFGWLNDVHIYLVSKFQKSRINIRFSRNLIFFMALLLGFKRTLRIRTKLLLLVKYMDDQTSPKKT